VVHPGVAEAPESGRGSLPAPTAPSELSLGLFAPTLTEQGFRPFFGEDQTDAFEADDKAISRLHARGLITYEQHKKAREKLFKRILGAWNSLPRDVGDAKLSSTKKEDEDLL
jgi:hypothetical protein